MAARGWGLDQDRNTESEAERGNGCQSLEGGRETHSWGWRYTYTETDTQGETRRLSNGDRPTGTEGGKQEKTRLRERERRDRGKDRDGERKRWLERQRGQQTHETYREKHKDRDQNKGSEIGMGRRHRHGGFREKMTGRQGSATGMAQRKVPVPLERARTSELKGWAACSVGWDPNLPQQCPTPTPTSRVLILQVLTELQKLMPRLSSAPQNHDEI